ncbi:MAG: hypothetical protein EOO27_04875 [Comamonadaceae bacterium]|nr:MAG: hypothetical protein EOO27_04875 [Comamonadaceae bacterium]
MSTRQDLTPERATRIAGGGLLVALGVTRLFVAGNGMEGPTAAVESAAILVALVLACHSRGWPRVGSVVVGGIAAGGLWFTIVDTEVGGAHAYVLFYCWVLGFPAMIMLSFFVTCAHASGVFRRS